MSLCVKKRKIPNKIGLASQMSKVRIRLIIDQESGNQPRKNKRKAKRKLEEPQEEYYFISLLPQSWREALLHLLCNIKIYKRV